MLRIRSFGRSSFAYYLTIRAQVTTCSRRSLATQQTGVKQPEIIKKNRQLVGRLLGNVVRESRGTAVYEKVEGIRE